MSKSSSKVSTKKSSKDSTNKDSTKKTVKAACCVYDFTLFDDISPQDIRIKLREYCKKYCFQKEKGEKTDKLHYQGRFSLKLKKRESELIKLIKTNFLWNKFNISITSTENRDNNFYVCKDDTRVDGPFTDENDVYIPLDVLEMTTLRPWQDKLIKELDRYDKRLVDVVFDPIGNNGKSSETRYMMIHKDAELLPFCNDYKDIMRMAYDVGPKKIYLIDMPRAISKDKLFQFFSGIETLKSGYAYDDRHRFQRRLFDRPRICIFTNTEPDASLLSSDMWQMWCIENNDLVKYTPTKNRTSIDNILDLEVESSE